VSIKFFDIETLVRVGEYDCNKGGHVDFTSHVLTVRMAMGPGATAKDAVEAFGRKLESVCKTVDIGDSE
jgi:hypothetical protein